MLLSQPLTIWQLFLSTFHNYKTIFPKIFYFVLLIAVLQEIPTLLGIHDLSTSILILNILLVPELFIDVIILLTVNNHFQNSEQTLKDIFNDVGKRFIPYLLLIIFTGLLFGVGLVLFIIPGFFIALFFLFSIFNFWLDKLPVFASIKASCQLVKENFWQSILGFCMLGLILLCSVGLSFLPDLFGIKNVTTIALSSILSYVIVSPFLLLFWIGLFYNLKIYQNQKKSV